MELTGNSLSTSKISEELLIIIELVQEIVDAKSKKIKKHKDMLRAVCEVTGHTLDQLVKLILVDGEELIKVLIRTFKLNIDVYTKVVKIFQAEQLSQIYVNSPMEKI